MLIASDINAGEMSQSSCSNTSDPNDYSCVIDPTIDAGGGDRFHKRAFKYAAGVVEARPGILEGTRIAPLDKDEPELGDPSMKISTGAASTDSGGAKMVHANVIGGKATVEEGRQEYYSERH